MDARDLLIDTFQRIHELYGDVVDGLDLEQAHWQPGGPADGGADGAGGNSIVWLLWHAARIEDDHIAGLADTEQAWAEWRERFHLPLDDWDHGYGHTSEQVASVRVDDLGLLSGYHEAVHARTQAYLDRADADELGRVVDRNWDPPVTAGVRLVSVVGDALQHLGQAAYIRGLPAGS